MPNLVKIKKNGTVTLQATREQAKKFYVRVHRAYYAGLQEQMPQGQNATGGSAAQAQENVLPVTGKVSSKNSVNEGNQKVQELLPKKTKQELAEEIPFFEDMPVSPDIAALLSHDLFYLLVYGMGRKDMDNDWLFARCREVQQNPNNHLDLWAREHYKSTIITIGLTILNVLQNPNITVGIFSHTRPIAKAFLRQIKREWETNLLLQAYFPFIAPPEKGEARTRTWSEDGGLIVRRDGNPKEATIEAWGLVDGQPTGKHFELLIYDDVVTLESVTTPEQEKRQVILQGDFCSYTARVQSQDIYNSVHIKYYDALKGKNFEYTYVPKNAPKVGKTLELNNRVASFAEAQHAAKAHLREKNKKAVEVETKIFPNPCIRCGSVIDFAPVSYLGEKFIVQEMQYSLEGRILTQNLKLNLCLDY